MANYAPFGVRPILNDNGFTRTVRYVATGVGTGTGLIPSGTLYAENMLVTLSSSGAIIPANGAGATDTRGVGVLKGVEFNDANSGRRTPAQWFTSAANQTDIWFWVYTDPSILFEVQAGASGGTISAATAIGGRFNVTNNTSTLPANPVATFTNVTSAGYLNTTAVTGTTVANLQVVELGSDINITPGWKCWCQWWIPVLD